jgi:phage terminase large subunit-like protein
VRVVIGVDPPAGPGGCGIVVAGLDAAGIGHVLADASVHGTTPEAWALAVASAFERHQADRVVVEINNGGEMVESVLRAASVNLPVKPVRASRGKVARAEPVSALYAAGRVRHAGHFPALEDEMCGLVLGGSYAGPGSSPDRADALVWAFTELMLGGRGPAPQVRVLGR